MLKSDLLPPHDGPDADPVLYGVAAVLAELFPPVTMHDPSPAWTESRAEGEADRGHSERD